MQMDELLKNRFSERDRELNKKILKSQNEMNSKGILHSSISVNAIQDILTEEFSCCRRTIASTISDSLKLSNVKLNRFLLENWAMDQLQKRQIYLDKYYYEKVREYIKSHQKQKMNAPCTLISQYYEHASQELAIELNSVFDNYENSLGATLHDRVLNKFKNYPIIVIPAVAIGVILAISELFDFIMNFLK